MYETNQVLISRLGGVAKPEARTPMEFEGFLSWLGDLSKLGFYPEPELADAAMKNATAAKIILDSVRTYMRADVDYVPLIGDFPTLMTEGETWELYVIAISHYVSGYLGIGDSSARIKRTIFADRAPKSLRKLVGVTTSEARTLLQDIIQQGQPFSEQDISDVRTLYSLGVPDGTATGVHENLATLVSIDEGWASEAKTLTDVLRIAAVLSGGDASLAEKPKFKLARRHRRLVTNTMERVLQENGSNYEDFTRFPELWKRLAMRGHLGDYAGKAVSEALTAVYTESARSFASRVEAAKAQSTVEAAHVLMERPGDFARRLMELVRADESSSIEITRLFRQVAPKVSLRVLVQLYDYLRGPSADVMPHSPLYAKSANAHGFIPNKRRKEDYYGGYIEAVEHGFAGRLKDRTLNADLDLSKQYAIPMGVRSASNSSKIVGRGSRLKLPEGTEVARLFVHWKNIEGQRVDLDLSASLLSEDLTRQESVWYGGLRNEDRSVYHSGDIVDAPNGAAEFIDVKLDAVTDYRYVVLSVLSYSGQSLSSIPETWGGVMAREGVNSGEHFEPADVVQRGDLVSDGRGTIPLALDLKTREVIWIDRAVYAQSVGASVYNTLFSSAFAEALLAPKMNVAEFLELTGAVISEDGEDFDPSRGEQVLGLLD